jgi:hypothetical protein
MKAFPRAAVLAVVSLLTVSGPTGGQQELNPADADSLAQKLEDMRERYLRGEARAKDFRVSDREVNAYLAHRLSDQIPKGVRGLWVSFAPDLFNAGGRVDLATVRDRIPDSSLAFLLQGLVPVELSARLKADGGMGKVEIQSCRLGGMEVPKALLQQLLTMYSKSSSRPEGLRLEDPFELPYGIRSARLLAGEAVLRQGPLQGQPGSR